MFSLSEVLDNHTREIRIDVDFKTLAITGSDATLLIERRGDDLAVLVRCGPGKKRSEALHDYHFYVTGSALAPYFNEHVMLPVVIDGSLARLQGVFSSNRETHDKLVESVIDAMRQPILV